MVVAHQPVKLARGHEVEHFQGLEHHVVMVAAECIEATVEVGVSLT